MTDPIDMLRRLQVSLVTGWMPREVANWLAAGVEKYLDGQPLDAALDLKAAPGKPNPPQQIRMADRDEKIRQAAQGMDGSLWAQAGILAQAVMDLDAGEGLTYLSEIRRSGLPLPQSQSQFFRILSGRRD